MLSIHTGETITPSSSKINVRAMVRDIIEDKYGETRKEQFLSFIDQTLMNADGSSARDTLDTVSSDVAMMAYNKLFEDVYPIAMEDAESTILSRLNTGSGKEKKLAKKVKQKRDKIAEDNAEAKILSGRKSAELEKTVTPSIAEEERAATNKKVSEKGIFEMMIDGKRIGSYTTTELSAKVGWVHVLHLNACSEGKENLAIEKAYSQHEVLKVMKRQR